MSLHELLGMSTRRLQLDLSDFNAGVTRARRDYLRHPTRSCIYQDCDHLADDGYMCNTHRTATDDAADRMRAYRRRVEKAAAQARYRARKKAEK